MVINLLFLADISKAGKRVFFISGVDLFKLFFITLFSQLKSTIGGGSFQRNNLLTFFKKAVLWYLVLLVMERVTIKYIWSYLISYTSI
ncbi:hypothetical protein HV346_14590 [Enterobacter sp. RHBSTW-00994]|nr:hypothetical protein HV346_14590 [Enterobacter sp. RHBSTW-00994]